MGQIDDTWNFPISSKVDTTLKYLSDLCSIGSSKFIVLQRAPCWGWSETSFLDSSLSPTARRSQQYRAAGNLLSRGTWAFGCLGEMGNLLMVKSCFGSAGLHLTASLITVLVCQYSGRQKFFMFPQKIAPVEGVVVCYIDTQKPNMYMKKTPSNDANHSISSAFSEPP
jgi:hypothetical protein